MARNKFMWEEGKGGTGRYREVQGGKEGKENTGGTGRKALSVVIFTFVLSLLLTLGINHPASAAPRHYTDIEFPSLPEVRLPAFNRYQLPNGLLVYLVEDHELPFISGTALIRVGDRWEPADQVGLGELTGTVLRTGGTKLRTGDEINQLLEQAAASVETGVGGESGSGGFSSLTEDVDQVFSLFAEILTQPVFSQEKLDFAKAQIRGSIARRNDNPEGIMGREFTNLIYGADSPYARSTEYATLDRIDRESIIKFYQQYFHPNNMILGISGDFDPQKMQKLIADKLGSWQPNPQLQLPPLPKVEQANVGGVFLVQQPQLNQSFVQLGHLGGLLKDADYATLDVVNNVMNGFGGRLFDEVRSRQGLAYSVYGFWSPRFDYPGVFVAGGQTRSEATVPFIKGIFGEIDRLRTSPISDTELKRAKDSTLNSFIFRFQTPDQTLSRLMRYEYYGYPQDFIFQYQRQVATTTIADIQRVAKTYLQPEKMVTLVVGNQAAIQPPLTTIDPEVKAIDITIPSGSPEKG
jgi:zinc protease